MTVTSFFRVQLAALDVLAATNREDERKAYERFVDERKAYERFVAEVRAAGASQALQANGSPPAPLVPAPNDDFVQPTSEDALQRREWNAQFNPTPVDVEVTKAAP